MADLDRVLGAREMSVAHLPRGQAQEVAVAVAVQRDLVTRVDDLARERRVAPNLLADEEERRLGTLAREYLEHRRRALRVRAVVERERVALAARRAVLDAERRAQRAATRPRAPGSR